MFVRPIRRFVLLLDDQDEAVEGGVAVREDLRCRHMDFTVVRVGDLEKADFGQGDRVVVSHPDAGRRVRLDGTYYRLVRVSDVIAKMEG